MTLPHHARAPLAGAPADAFGAWLVPERGSRLERRARSRQWPLQQCGYRITPDRRPLVTLACQGEPDEEAVPAAAADIAPYYREPLEVQPVYWTGAYAGTDVGAAWSNAFGSAGAIGGLYAGYNWQFAPQWLLGVELDGSWTESTA
jgi:hypothetical protein